ncbi:MAG: methyltransferase domain-containing protein [Chloroflexi bacterium]|mgnify:FL=1|nr:methyltransferase domain-containing protein [Chloroflexota bacterium]MBT5628042.1 methyltransferase domain-containing protein [Chloroflexota bacterium]
MPDGKNTERFAGKSDVYQSARPGYPEELSIELQQLCSISNGTRIADLGSGTGIFSKLLLDTGAEVVGVEPNSDMRQAAEQDLADFERFRSISGSAEKTNLQPETVDVVTAAQAFHWFDTDMTVREIKRITKTKPLVALVWNQRDTSDTFQSAYDEALRSILPEYEHVVHTRVEDSQIESLFLPVSFDYREWGHSQVFDLEQFQNRMASSSYVPTETNPIRQRLDGVMQGLFREFQNNGTVDFRYVTKLYVGVLA